MKPLNQLRLLVIGTGLIGGSWAKGLKVRGQIAHVSAYSRNTAVLEEGRALGVLDQALANEAELDEAIEQADVIVLGVPTLAVKHYLARIEQHRQTCSVVTDVASVKGEIANMLIEHFSEVPSWFVLGHPIAGSEKSGITASNPDLYVNHHVILTPCDNTDKQALSLIEELWQAVGADVVCMPIKQHDKVLASTSHLPHALAFSLVDTLRAEDDSVDIFCYAAGGFRDFSRIAASHPVMWHDIMLANKTAILEVMGDFRAKLDELELAMKTDDSASILAMFERAKSSREDFSALLEERQSRPVK